MIPDDTPIRNINNIIATTASAFGHYNSSRDNEDETAAMVTTSNISFHCIICYEDFDSEVNYPVILPCGHTYICVQCANRITKCMECRTSLFAEDDQEEDYHYNGGVLGYYNKQGLLEYRGRSRSCSSVLSAAARSGRRPSGDHRVVEQQDSYYNRGGGRGMPMRSSSLGSVLGSGSSSAAAARSGRSPSITRCRTSSQGNGVAVAPSPRKRERERLPLPKNTVLLSLVEAGNLLKKNTHAVMRYSKAKALPDDSEGNTSLLSAAVKKSSCGTYIVTAQEGLRVLPTMDRNKKMKSLRNLFSKGAHLRYGDVVQIVFVMGNWAKLARGHGYAYLENEGDLVKVHGAIDKACILESKIHIISSRRKNMRKMKSKMEKDAVKMMVELRNTLLSGNDLTIQANQQKDMETTLLTQLCEGMKNVVVSK